MNKKPVKPFIAKNFFTQDLLGGIILIVSTIIALSGPIQVFMIFTIMYGMRWKWALCLVILIQ